MYYLIKDKLLYSATIYTIISSKALNVTNIDSILEIFIRNAVSRKIKLFRNDIIKYLNTTGKHFFFVCSDDKIFKVIH